MGHNGCDGLQAFGPWAIGSGYRFSMGCYPKLSGRCCPLAVVATSPGGVQCPVPAPACAHTYWRMYVPGRKRKMRKCGQRGELTVRLEGFLRHPPPWTRRGPLCRHPTAGGGADCPSSPWCLCTHLRAACYRCGGISALEVAATKRPGALVPRVSATPERDGGP